MTEENRRCRVYDAGVGLDEEGTFIKFGKSVTYDDGNNPIPIDIAIVELDSGKVVELKPKSISFIK